MHGKTLQPSWATSHDPTVIDSAQTSRQLQHAIEQARADAEDRKARRLREAEDFIVAKLDDEARKALSDVVRFRRSIGVADGSVLATARLLLGEERDVLLRQAKAFVATLKDSK